MAIYGLPTINSNAIKAFLFHTLRGTGDAGWATPIAGQVMPSDQGTETHVGLGATHPLRQWVGQRNARTLRELQFPVENFPYEGTLLVTGDEWRGDKTGQVQRRIADLKVRYDEHWESLLSAKIIAGETTACYDSSSFFHTAHSEGASGSQDNDLTHDVETTTAPTSSEMETGILKATQAILGFKDDSGEPCNAGIRSFTVMVPTPFMGAAAGALNAPFVADGTVGPRTNVLTVLGGFQFSLVINPRLTWTTKFAVFANTGTALIRQEEVAGLVGGLDENSDEFFKTDTMQFGIFCKRGVGFGDWKQACLVTLV